MSNDLVILEGECNDHDGLVFAILILSIPVDMAFFFQAASRTLGLIHVIERVIAGFIRVT